MIAPIVPYKIKGVLWYQGEANRKRAWQYRKLFPILINSWRNEWDQGPFPFYYVQLAPYQYGDEDPNLLPEIRESQLYTMQTIINTGMAVTVDIGDIEDIHPKEKQKVADRLLLWALAKDYGQKNLVYSGPVYNSMIVEQDKIRIMFDSLGQGLVSTGNMPLNCFTIAGEDKIFHPANAIIERNTVLVGSPKVSEPVAVRFCWSKTDIPNLYNRNGLPAVPFRTDDWPAVTLNEK
jgi:sialate O-acetylesterase